MTLGARLITSSTGDHRTIEAENFFVDLLTTALQPNEILSEIVIPGLAPRTGTAYAKFGNKASHFAIVGVAASITLSPNGTCEAAHIGVTGAGASASRAIEAESLLNGRRLMQGNQPDDDAIKAAAARAGAGIDFQEDVHASGEYRAHLTAVFAERAIREAVSRAR